MKMVKVAVSEDMARYLNGAYYIVPAEIPDEMVERGAGELVGLFERFSDTALADEDRRAIARSVLATAFNTNEEHR